MLFHTWPFLVFMLVVLPVFFALRRTKLWIPWLMGASYFFYGWWNPWYLILVVYSTALDYLLVTLMDDSRGRGAARGFEIVNREPQVSAGSPPVGAASAVVVEALSTRRLKPPLHEKSAPLRVAVNDPVLKAAFLVSS